MACAYTEKRASKILHSIKTRSIQYNTDEEIYMVFNIIIITCYYCKSQYYCRYLILVLVVSNLDAITNNNTLPFVINMFWFMNMYHHFIYG